MSNEPVRKVFIKTYGCQMNVYDSDRMIGILSDEGYITTSDPAEADLVILNTCHIREKAAEKVYSELGRIRSLKQKHNGEMLVAVAGCVAQAEGEEIVRRAPAVDLVFGPQSYHRLPELIRRRQTNGQAVVEAEFPAEEKFGAMKNQVLGRQVSAFLTVQEGCDKFCTFCVVPYTRGAEYSRPVDQVIAEARAMATAGIREITLLGQNVNAYHGRTADGETCNLASLIARLSQIDGIERWRYTTSHPREMDAELIEAHAVNPKLMPYLHLPVQAGSNRVLKAMNRGHTAQDYIRTIERVRAARPGIAIAGDFIVGFPGETENDFRDTLELVNTIGYANAYSFKYSARPGTPAASREDQVPDEVKAERLGRLQNLLAEQAKGFLRSLVGQTMPVLLERAGRHGGQLTGRSPYLCPVHLEAPGATKGDILDVVINGVSANSLSAHIRQAA